MGGFCSMQQRPYKTKQRLIREPERNIPLSVCVCECERERERENEVLKLVCMKWTVFYGAGERCIVCLF